MALKTDNSNLAAKLELRRYFLQKYHVDRPPDVLDCCQGEGVIWQHLRREFEIATYWGIDVKAKKGRLKLDSVRVLAQPGWSQNVVDVDTWGSPWKHWEALVRRISRPTTVFLTIGQLVTWVPGRMSKEVFQALGLKELMPLLPNAFHVKLSPLALSYCLTRSCDYAKLMEAVEAIFAGGRNARYIGVRLEPTQKTNGRGAATPGRSEPEQVGKEPAHV